MHELDYLFHPKSVAIVGAGAQSGSAGVGVWPQVLPALGFSGDLYLVGPGLSESGNSNAYERLTDIPASVELVIIGLAASGVPQIVKDCVSKGVKAAHIYSAGFCENGANGAKLQKEIIQIAKRGGVRLLGPNCMGLYSPSAGLAWRPDFPRKSGDLGFLSQSGFNATSFLKQASARGVRFSKVVNYGNACDLNETDFLECFASDPETNVIAAYIEGVKDGQRFFRALREASKSKPVILLRGGRTEAGKKATASHTGALSTKESIWDSLFKQTGAISTNSLEELIDTVVAFLFMPPLPNQRTAIIGPGGGPNVLATDHFFRAGLKIPPLSEDIRKKLSKFTPKAGTSLANPIDIIIGWTPENWAEAIETIGNSNEADLFLIHLGMTYQHLLPGGVDNLKATNTAIINAAKKCPIPTAIALYNVRELMETSQEERDRFVEAGLPLFPSIPAAAQAIGKLLQYQDFRSSLTKANS